MRWVFPVFLCLLVSACSGAVPDGPDLDIILADKPAKTLSAYGLFRDSAARQPAAGVVPYELINPLFSDYSEKERLVFVPKGQTVDWSDEGVLAFPVGSVLIKSFSYPETGRIETRLLVHKAAGWVGYPYVWNADQSDAIYSPIGKKEPIQIADPKGQVHQITYSVPNQNQCKTCHQAGDKVTPIGPKARNLGVDQIAQWRTLGLVQTIPETFDVVPAAHLEFGSTAARARAYLDINCGHCHKSDGAASNSGLWLEWTEESLVKLGIGKHPTAAGRGAGQLTRVIEPGAPEASILAYRMASREAGVAMPELGRSLNHEDGLALINEWIREMQND
jgi:uncharacterized repeat protein (TIGR03806 family)